MTPKSKKQRTGRIRGAGGKFTGNQSRGKRHEVLTLTLRLAALFALLILACGFALVGRASAQEESSAEVARFEAEDMAYGAFAKDIAAIYSPSGVALKWLSDGTATKTVTTTAEGQSVVVVARGIGAPTMRVYLDGSYILETQVQSTAAWAEHVATVGIPSGEHEIAIEGVGITSTRFLVVDVVSVPAVESREAPPPPAPSDCDHSLQARIDAAQSGSTVNLDDCIYREQVEIDKPLTLQGQQRSEIRGSEVWTEWSPSSAEDTFVSAQSVPAFYQEDASCEKGHSPQCAWQEQVFVDGSKQDQVAASLDPTPGEFKVDASSRRIVLGSNPAGKVVEVTTRKHWITGTASADNVTIRNIDMRHAASDWRCGGIQSREPSTGSGQTFDSCRNGANAGDGDGWKLYDSDISYAHGAGVSLRGDNSLIENNFIHHNGELGIHNPGDGSSVVGNEVAHNNTEHFCIRPSTDYCDAVDTDGTSGIQSGSPLTESGGMKIAGGKANITVDSNHFHHNYGNAIWFDVGVHDVVASNNFIHHNARRGIFFELSKRADIFGNTLYENGWASPDGVNGAGLELGNSDDSYVYGNVVAWNADGLVVRCANRDPGDESTCTGNRIENNVIVQEKTPSAKDGFPGLALTWAGNSTLFASANGNGGSGNGYWYSYPEDGRPRFSWNGKLSALSAFNATPGEEDGRYLTESEKEAVMANKGIPANPEPRLTSVVAPGVGADDVTITDSSVTESFNSTLMIDYEDDPGATR